ncbi:Clp protease N-terminal domain-containing protein [Actinomadura terrae]|uniref:Clp protease N-terminal domain-containing protein n=1 Tax=Actinomadura terrae TaxID=604353 RepID=UPI001FA715E1|nr:Clp protease N-terminal domain-containing protein [Actinomadura terrae]
MFGGFPKEIRELVAAAVEEAKVRGDRRAGTEHLLLAVLRDPGAPAADALGVDLDGARGALDRMDRRALEEVGIRLGEPPPPLPPSDERLPLTAAAKTALDRCVKEAFRSRQPQLEARHLLLALLGARSHDPVLNLLAELGVDRDAVRQKIRTDLPAHNWRARGGTGTSA